MIRRRLLNENYMIYFQPKEMSMVDFPNYFGFITSPNANPSKIPLPLSEGRMWCLDNNAFTTGFNPNRYFSLINKFHPFIEQCMFAVIPDRVGDASETLKLYYQWYDEFKQLGVPLAYVSQDGQDQLPLPEDFQWLFIGGTDNWKMSKRSEQLIRKCQSLGKKIHVGRVNSLKRMMWCKYLNVNSVDGTHIKFGPDINKKKLIRWMHKTNSKKFLIGGTQ